MLGGWGGAGGGVFGARHRDLRGPGGVSPPLQPPPPAREPLAGGGGTGVLRAVRVRLIYSSGGTGAVNSKLPLIGV